MFRGTEAADYREERVPVDLFEGVVTPMEVVNEIVVKTWASSGVEQCSADLPRNTFATDRNVGIAEWVLNDFCVERHESELLRRNMVVSAI